MRYAPPPMLPPDPGPKPAPFPSLTPPREPLPIPAPEPGPLEAIIDFASGSPSTSMFTLGMLASGWMTNVGSITNFGSGLRITAIGGTNCLSDSLGSLPLLAGVGERAPPPPPPAIGSFFNVGLE